MRLQLLSAAKVTVELQRHVMIPRSQLQARGVATLLREASNRDHRIPDEFDTILGEALNWIVPGA